MALRNISSPAFATMLKSGQDLIVLVPHWRVAKSAAQRFTNLIKFPSLEGDPAKRLTEAAASSWLCEAPAGNLGGSASCRPTW